MHPGTGREPNPYLIKLASIQRRLTAARAQPVLENLVLGQFGGTPRGPDRAAKAALYLRTQSMAELVLGEFLSGARASASPVPFPRPWMMPALRAATDPITGAFHWIPIWVPLDECVREGHELAVRSFKGETREPQHPQLQLEKKQQHSQQLQPKEQQLHQASDAALVESELGKDQNVVEDGVDRSQDQDLHSLDQSVISDLARTGQQSSDPVVELAHLRLDTVSVPAVVH